MQTSETPSLPAADNSSGKPRVNLVSLWRFLGRLVHSLTGSLMQPARLLLRAQCLGFFGAPPQDLPVKEWTSIPRNRHRETRLTRGFPEELSAAGREGVSEVCI